MAWDEIWMAVGPFDQRDAVAKDVVIKSQLQDGLAVLEPVKIEMINWQPAAAVFVHQNKGRAGYICSALQAGDESFYELRLPGAKVARERENIPLCGLTPIS